MKEQIRLAGRLSESLVNGPGLREVVFAQICKHHCKGCFNPETHSETGGTLFDIDDVIKHIQASPLIDGVTFSGGDPFEQAAAFTKIATAVKKPNFTIWCYTGYTFEALFQSSNKDWHTLLNAIDVLVDGPFEEALYDPNLKFRGSSNQKIIDVPLSLKQGKAVTLTY